MGEVERSRTFFKKKTHKFILSLYFSLFFSFLIASGGRTKIWLGRRVTCLGAVTHKPSRVGLAVTVGGAFSWAPLPLIG